MFWLPCIDGTAEQSEAIDERALGGASRQVATLEQRLEEKV